MSAGAVETSGPKGQRPDYAPFARLRTCYPVDISVVLRMRGVPPEAAEFLAQSLREHVQEFLTELAEGDWPELC